jgi:hypothetical protein
MFHIFTTRIAASIADQWFDKVLRTSILEGAAGVHPGTWTRDSMRGFDKALDHFNLRNSPWAARDSGLYSALIRASRATLGRSGLYDSADDLVQSIIAGETLPSPGGEPAAVGQHLRDEIQIGSGLERARALLLKHLKQRALNMIRGSDRERARIGPGIQEGIEGPEGQVGQYPGSSLYSVDPDDIAVEEFLSGPDADRAKAWLMDLWSRELRDSDFNVINAWLANPNKNFTQLGRELGISGSFIGKAVVRAREIAQRAIVNDPPDFVRTMQMREELAPLSIGVRSRKASDITRFRTAVSIILRKMASAF